MVTDVLRVSVIYAAAPRQLCEVVLTLPAPCSAWAALEQSGLLQRFTELAGADLLLGVWGQRVLPTQMLRHQDRLEIYRPLKVDPKLARRRRFAQQGERTAGLFVRRRPGAKAGY